MKRILVGIDASPESRLAATFAVNLAVETGAKVILAGVVTVGDPLVSPELQARFKAFEDEQKVSVGKMLEGFAAELRRPEVTIETVVDGGPPAAMLADLAEKLNVDLVVVGHRGRGAVKRLFLGSVADRLVQICTRPVTVVR